jgi:hypothetical protein
MHRQRRRLRLAAGVIRTRTEGAIVVQPPGGSGNIVYEEQLLRRAAEDAADRILKVSPPGDGKLLSFRIKLIDNVTILFVDNALF